MSLESFEVKSPADLRWWPDPGKGDETNAPHTKVFTALRRIQSRQSYRAARDALHLQLFGDLRYVGYHPTQADFNWYDLFDAQSTENVIRSVVQTHHAKIVKNKPRATCVTEGGNWEFRQRAKNMDKFVSGQMYQRDGYTLTNDGLMHALIVGTGAIKVFNDGEDVQAVPAGGRGVGGGDQFDAVDVLRHVQQGVLDPADLHPRLACPEGSGRRRVLAPRERVEVAGGFLVAHERTTGIGLLDRLANLLDLPRVQVHVLGDRLSREVGF